MKIELTEKEESIRQNLIIQIKKINRNANERSYKTRERYYDATERFCGFMAQNYHLQKFSNVRDKHIYEYVNYLKEAGTTTKTIKTELSGIRYFHDHSGSKNNLPDNDKLDLGRVETGKIDRAWTKDEIEDAIVYAKAMGRDDVAYIISLAYLFGVRLEEACVCTVKHIKEAIETDELFVKGKGGQIRYVPLRNADQMELLNTLLKQAKLQGKTLLEKVFVDSVKGGVQAKKNSIDNWIYSYRENFTDRSKRMQEHNEEERKRAAEMGIKLASENLTMHGLRYYYAQQQFQYYIDRGYSEREARKNTSENLGHHRAEITRLYLSKS